MPGMPGGWRRLRSATPLRIGDGETPLQPTQPSRRSSSRLRSLQPRGTPRSLGVPTASPSQLEVERLREENKRLRALSKGHRAVRPYLTEDDDEWIAWLYRPHTIVGLVCTMVTVLAAPMFTWLHVSLNSNQPSQIMRERLGLLSVTTAFLGYCAFQMRDSILIRPHPMFWRVVHGWGILYLLFLIHLLNMDLPDARKWLQTLSPELNNTYPPEANTRVYAVDCRLDTRGDARGRFYVFWNTAFDIFFVAHLVGWVGKAVVFRDFKIALSLSVMWEVFEYSFQHVLPNFTECWWDHWVLDVGLANLGGLVIGLYINHQLHIRCYDWTGDFPPGRGTPDPRRVTFVTSAKRLLTQFTPRSFDVYSWDVFSNLQRFGAVAALLLVSLLVELSGFFLKFILWVPPENLLNTYRLLIWGFLTIPSTREWYAYISNPASKRPGPNVWVALFIISMEIAIIFKHSDTWMPPPGQRLPSTVMWGWAGFFMMIGIWLLLKFVPCFSSWAVKWKQRNQQHRGSGTDVDSVWWSRGRLLHSHVTNISISTCVAPLAWMCWSLDAGYGTHYHSHIKHGFAPYALPNGTQIQGGPPTTLS